MPNHLKSLIAGTASTLALVGAAHAADFNIPAGDLKGALGAYMAQSGVTLLVSGDTIRGARTQGVNGNLSADSALSQLLSGTGFAAHRDASGLVGIVRERSSSTEISSIELAQATPVGKGTVETVTVTSSKLGGADVQSIPIAITALSQEQLTATQTAGGPDLVKQVPNLTFTKTNFTGYNIQIRGIGTQAISVTTDPAVAIAFNDTPFIRNHFFEQEFYDVGQVEVLRGPQGTLYGRNATSGVVNVTSAKPTDQFEAMASADLGNYRNRRFEGMINLPIVDDRLDLRVAGEWTKRNGYTFNETTGQSVDGRDLWSGRITMGWKPFENVQTYLIWEHFSESDDRVRSTKQLCKKDEGPTSVDGTPISTLAGSAFNEAFERTWLSQGCQPTSLYSPDAFETPNGQSIPFVAADEFLFAGGSSTQHMLEPIDPYANQTQSRDLRVIESHLDPTYRAKNDTIEFNADIAVAPQLTLTSQTGYNKDFLNSTEDFNRFDTVPGLFGQGLQQIYGGNPVDHGVYCDPQLGCSSAMVGEDLSQERAWQFSQEVRLASHFDGPLNFSVGANYMHYQTVEDYYVFFNLISATEQTLNGGGPGDYSACFNGFGRTNNIITPQPVTHDLSSLGLGIAGFPSNFACSQGFPLHGTYIDPHSIDQLDGLGHNYFKSENPYRLNSWAGFGEAYYQLTPDVKLVGGLRWTDDSKWFADIPSQVFLLGGGYPVSGIVQQEWKEWTGRFVANWTPKFNFTDMTLLYASYSRGYKGGGANPPGPAADALSASSFATHPATFAPEFVNAYELGTKNTLLDGSMTLNGDVFFYDYTGYQISQIIDRTSINLNFNAKVKGAELEATWEPIPGLRFNFAGGLEDSSVGKGQSAIDLMDRTDGNSDWLVVKPFLTDTSNCVLPAAAVRQVLQVAPSPTAFNGLTLACDVAYNPVGLTANPFAALFAQQTRDAFAAAGFDPSNAPNGGAGFAKDLSGNKLPNAPPFTLSVGAQYSMPVTPDWAGTLRGDFYWQGNSFARIFNDKPYDRLRGYTNLNLSLIFTNQGGWQAMAYVKNIFDTTAITGAFLNSDDTALTTNVFATDPRLFGVRLTKNW